MSCSQQTLTTEITSDKFDNQTEVVQFDSVEYIDIIDPIISSSDYIRLDSIFLDEDNQETVIITDQIIENILNVYNLYEVDHNTYEIINFFDLHIKKLSSLDIDILVNKIVSKIETDYNTLKNVVVEPEFLYITQDYNNRLTTTYLDNYQINEEAISLYPEIELYIKRLRTIVNGGYQIRKFGDKYYIFPDYASILVRYDDYYGEETNDLVSILVSNSRNIVKAGDTILMDNEGIAYQINQIEVFLKKYPNSVYHELLKGMYQEYFITLLTNPSNTEELTSRVIKYHYYVITDFKEIVDRYSGTQMSRLLNQLVEYTDENATQYDQEIIDEIIEKIKTSY
jgi:hypothetical protein